MTLCPKCGAALDCDGTCVACLLAGGFGTELPTLDSAGGATIEVDPSQSLDYDSFGPYRILRVLGEGGMGAVYLAEQTEPLKRQVALKVVKLGIDSSQILSRFDYERQALALMDHPNIAHVYDAGASQKGRPYFVMEFVDGLPITQYCDQHRLNTAERLELFIPVCQALQHAHQKGVIHRDIKPSNVMVKEQDGRPVPKVIDFGIAKATDQRAVENAAFTNFGQFIGTPEYMSPEQADVLTGDIDTSSDVYSLGVLLYELLIGAVPFDAQTLRKAGLSELLRIIREDEAIPMTAKLTGMGATATEVAGRRRTDPGTLRRQVTGDLNWIVIKAMEKDRQRRYPAVSELAADIRRHLDDQPVLASPPSPMYRTRKFVRRHKAGVVAAAAVLVALVGGMVATSWEATVASRERAEALRQRTDALQQRADAVAARALAEQSTRETLAERNRAEEQTALAVRQQEVAERQRTVAEARLADVHVLADSMLFELNDDVKDLLGGTKAREALVSLGQQYLNKENAATLATTIKDPQRRRKLAEAFIKLGELQGTPGQSNLRDIAGASESFGRSIAILEPDVKTRPHDLQLRHLLTLAYLRLVQLDEDGPAQYAGYKRALKSADILLRQWPNDPQGLRDRAEVLDFRMKSDAWSRSILPAEAVEIRQRVLAGNPTDVTLRWDLARSQSILGVSLIRKKSQEALDWLKKSYDGFQALREEEPASAQYQRDCANTLARIASALAPLNRFDEAEARAREAVSILERLTAADRRNASFRLDLSFAQNILAAALFNNSQITEAIQCIAKSIAIQEEQAARFPDNPDFPRQAAAYYRQLAVYRIEAADAPGSMTEYRRAEAIDRKLAARYPGSFEFSDALRLDLQGVGMMFGRLGDRVSALREYHEAVDIARSAPSPPTSPAVAALISTRHSLALGLAAMSRWDEAIAEQRAVVAIAETRLAGQLDNQGLQRSVSHAYRDLAKLYDRRGDTQSAIAASGKALPFLEADYAAHRDDLTTGRELWNMLFYLGNQYTRAADYDRGIAAGRRSVEIAEQVTASHLGDYARGHYLSTSLLNFADTLRMSGRREEGLANLRRAVSVLDLHPIEKEASPVLRRETADDYLSIVNILSRLSREEEGLVLLTRILPVLEALARDNPGNNPYRKSLLRACQLAATTFLTVDDLPGALDFEKKRLGLEPPPDSPSAWEGQGLLLAHTGSLELRLDRPDAAQKLWRDALTMFQRAASDSEKEWSADKKNVDALEMLSVSERWAAFTLEELGDIPLALRYLESSYARAASLLKSAPETPANRRRYEESQRDVVRVVWLMAGDHGDYRPFFENGNPTQEQVRPVLARSWSEHASLMFSFGNPLPQLLAAAAKSVDLARRLVGSNPSAANQVVLARSIEVSGAVFRAMAHSAAGAEKLSRYGQSRDAYFETLQILNSLKEAGKLPDYEKANLITLAIALADVDERLQGETHPINAKR